MLTWAHWATQQYQQHNVTNIHQATWYPQQSYAQYSQYSVYTPNSQVRTYNRPVNNFNYSESIPNFHRTKQNSSNINSSTPQPPSEQRQMNSTMETEDYYQLSRFNLYSVHFRNRTALSVDEIRDICSGFGEIDSCKQTGDATGIVFVNFKIEDAARKCVEGLRNHSIIQLRPTKNNGVKNKIDSDVPKNYEHSGSKKFDYSPSPSSSGLNNSFEREKINCKGSNNSHEGSVKSHTTEEYGTRKMSASLPFDITKNYSTVTSGGNGNGPGYGATDKRLATMDPSVDEHDSVPMNLPELIPAGKKSKANGITTNVIEDKKIDLAETRMEVIEAQEIIVANIQEDYGVPAILHLLEKYEPICASPIKICKSHSLRYCHVFFTNIRHAEAAEYDFDNFEWAPSKKLIVLRVNTLAFIASSS